MVQLTLTFSWNVTVFLCSIFIGWRLTWLRWLNNSHLIHGPFPTASPSIISPRKRSAASCIPIGKRRKLLIPWSTIYSESFIWSLVIDVHCLSLYIYTIHPLLISLVLWMKLWYYISNSIESFRHCGRWWKLHGAENLGKLPFSANASKYARDEPGRLRFPVDDYSPARGLLQLLPRRSVAIRRFRLPNSRILRWDDLFRLWNSVSITFDVIRCPVRLQPDYHASPHFLRSVGCVTHQMT